MRGQVAEDGLHEPLRHLQGLGGRGLLASGGVQVVVGPSAAAVLAGGGQPQHCGHMLVVLQAGQHDAKLHALSTEVASSTSLLFEMGVEVFSFSDNCDFA